VTSSQNTGNCRHLWVPYADAERIWQVCQKCGTEEHVTTHREQLAENLRWIMTVGTEEER
jgi:hypothetical protein